MKQFIFILAIILLISCKKDEHLTDPATKILIAHKWYAAEVHAIQYNNTTNVVLKDTTYITAACEQKSFSQFLPDSLFPKQFVCEPVLIYNPGKWYISNDSLTALLWIPLSYGTGVIWKNMGINPSKLIDIDDAHFIVKHTQNYYSAVTPGGLPQFWNEVTFTTYKSQ